MSHIFSESYIKEKLRRLEEISEYNKARLAIFNTKKTAMSRREYERIKQIIFGTAQPNQRQSFQISTQDNQKGLNNNNNTIQINEQKQQKKTSTSVCKSKGKTKSLTQAAGAIVHSSNIQNKLAKNATQQGYQTAEFQQRSNLNEQPQYYNENQKQQDPNDKRYSTPKQQAYEKDSNSLDQIEQQNGQINQHMVTFNSAEKKRNNYNLEVNEDYIHYKTNDYAEFLFEQQKQQSQFKKNLKKIEEEKLELQNQLYDLQLKAASINLYSQKQPKMQKRAFDEAFKQLEQDKEEEQKEQQSDELRTLLNSIRKESPRKSPKKQIVNGNLSQESLKKMPNYRNMQKKIGLDFESQWNMLEKVQSQNEIYHTTLFQTAPIQRNEEYSYQQQNNRDNLNQISQDKQENSQKKKYIQSFLSSGENWETQFNKIGKTLEERQTILDNEINFGTDFIGRKSSKPLLGNYVVDRYTIDKLSDEIDLLIRYSKLHDSQYSSLHSPFKNKRHLFEIPEEYSQDNSVNY